MQVIDAKGDGEMGCEFGAVKAALGGQSSEQELR
jgi:hypothetical protein